MPKIKMLSRNPDDYIRETVKDINKLHRNPDPMLHPFMVQREYIQALNATKLERVFAKPFVGSLDGHRDGIAHLCKHPTKLALLMSGACDGEIRSWNLPTKSCISTVQAHDRGISGLCANVDGKSIFSCGPDKIVKQWRLGDEGKIHTKPLQTWLGSTVYQGMDHHWSENKFATCGEQTDIWDETRTEPVKTFQWGVASVHCIRFNAVETYMLGATASDRSILLYDMRAKTPLKKVILRLRSNALAWNPQETLTFTVANEDYNLYTFDLRDLSRPRNIHMDHTSAVMDVDYSPTGKEFVSACYDKSIRIFDMTKGHSREIYTSKRMQRVIAVRWSLDNKYIMCGSDEMNIRLWKARASEKIAVLKPREKAAFNKNEMLKEMYAHHPAIKRISRHRHVPKMIYNQNKEMQAIRKAQKRKEMNVRAHTAPEKLPDFEPARKKAVVDVS